MRALLPTFTLVLLLLLPNNNTFAASKSEDQLQAECVKCHKELIEKDSSKRYIHQPFADGKCLSCHVVAKNSSSAAEQFPDEKSKPKIRWLNLSPLASVEHTFLLQEKLSSGNILIEAKAAGKNPLRQTLTIPPAENLAKINNDHTPPHITNIRADVQQGILIDAWITWQTDEKTDAAVTFGVNGDEQIIADKQRFVTDHKISLPGLKSGSTYRLVITCQDIFGNSATSPVFTFSTAKISPLPHPVSANPGTSSGKIAIKSSFSSMDDKNIMLEVTANQPVTIALGTSDKEPAQRRILLKKSGQSADTAKEHPPLANKMYSSLMSCVTCHRGFNKQKSHPVNILPSEKTKITTEYPTLPDGRISCMTCHIYHAANMEFRLVKSSRKELCLGCHPDKF